MVANSRTRNQNKRRNIAKKHEIQCINKTLTLSLRAWMFGEQEQSKEILSHEFTQINPNL